MRHKLRLFNLVLIVVLVFIFTACTIPKTAAETTAAVTTAIGKIAYISYRDGNSEIYIMNVDGSEQVRLTNNPAEGWGPTFSSDGFKIAFTSDRYGNYEIYTMNIDGSEQINLTNNSALDMQPSFSPDGSKITFD
jgi:Tol biopolymer transport system component